MCGEVRGERVGPWTRAAVGLLLAMLAGATSGAKAQREPPLSGDEHEAEPPGESDGADGTKSKANAVAEAPAVRIEAGAPRPPVQSIGVAPPPAAPSPPTVKVGGGLILAYFHPLGSARDAARLGGPTRKPTMEAFRANILLDSKVNRYGVHIDIRVRDKKVRGFFDSTSWLEEAYVSADLLSAERSAASLTLKAGKVYAQFGRFFDLQFYGNLGLRDGFKLDPNCGVSLEGVLGRGKVLGALFYAQYFVTDGGTNTSLDNRDVISNPAPHSGYPGGLGRKRNMFVARVEPSLRFSPTTSLKVGASVQNYTADWGPTLDQENVLRYGADVTAELGWFGAWAEYAEQRGVSTRNSPFPPSPAIDMATDPYGRASSAARPGRASDHVRHLITGARIAYKGVMLRYHFSAGDYESVTYPIADVDGVDLPKVRVREQIHTPGVSIFLSPQISLWIEHPIWTRHMEAATLILPASAGGRTSLPAQHWTVDKQLVVTLHGVI